MIGSCDCCNAEDVEVSRTFVTGIETFACDKCRGVEEDGVREITKEETKPIVVDIGAAYAMLQESPELCAAMNEMVGGPALVEAQAEIERLTAALKSEADYFEGTYGSHMGMSGDYVANRLRAHLSHDGQSPDVRKL